MYKNRGKHKACLDVQKAMLHCKRTWNEYYILKMDIKKYSENVNKNISYELICKKVKDKKLLQVLKQIIFSTQGETGQPYQ